MEGRKQIRLSHGEEPPLRGASALIAESIAQVAHCHAALLLATGGYFHAPNVYGQWWAMFNDTRMDGMLSTEDSYHRSFTQSQQSARWVKK
ncbi:hypothetical protein NDU88_004347 [Pleurodeles waltl]|uniref:Uncharacterized protein n=1 Tax=Pleurodeles waltl TaxID=8319 RepID=A0AAV7T7V8_PLEWA|nr:hypothetical protein NDU88_004347 [Pleurodeles waltl]